MVIMERSQWCKIMWIRMLWLGQWLQFSIKSVLKNAVSYIGNLSFFNLKK